MRECRPLTCTGHVEMLEDVANGARLLAPLPHMTVND